MESTLQYGNKQLPYIDYVHYLKGLVYLLMLYPSSSGCSSYFVTMVTSIKQINFMYIP